MNQQTDLENRRKDYPDGSYDLYFYEPPRIGHRGDALALLDDLMGADYVYDADVAQRALRDAIAREVV